MRVETDTGMRMRPKRFGSLQTHASVAERRALKAAGDDADVEQAFSNGHVCMIDHESKVGEDCRGIPSKKYGTMRVFRGACSRRARDGAPLT